MSILLLIFVASIYGRVETGKTDKELIEHWLEGDERAFEHLFQRHVHKLYLFTAEQVNDRETAKEMVKF